MKKILIIMLSLLLACSIVWAEEGTGSVNSDDEGGNAQATATVTLDLSGSEGAANYWEIGFTTADVTSAESPESLPSTAMILSDGKMTAEDDGKVWVYWIIKGGQKVNISLAADGALRDPYDNKIDWNVTWEDGEKKDQKLGPEELKAEKPDPEVTVYTTAKNVHTRSSSTGGDYGAVQLDFITEDFTAAVAGKYEATLTLTIESNGTT